MNQHKYKPFQILIVSRNGVKQWTSESKKLEDLNLQKNNDEFIVNPSFSKTSNKIIYAKNIIAENIGSIVIADKLNGKTKTIFSGKGISSPVVSRDKRKIAFLSNRNSKGCLTLFVLNLLTMKCEKYDDSCVLGEGYNSNLSWLPSNDSLLYTDTNGYIVTFDIKTRQKKSIIKGFDPTLSPNGKMILYKKTINKPYYPYIFSFKTNESKKICIKKVMNATWSLSDLNLLIVKNISSIFNWNEWEREVVTYNLENDDVEVLFRYEGFEYINIGRIYND
ncbi:hypothetical protein [Desulfosarcina ovata]|uniref:Protein TolB n=1 Tax=Desulfosarcina ovata subsp. ovata TaxID=2752305 RepID=A0A5K8A4U6_9BACT|nr:hypothetical protein [Desulfosarcina ovata]BBO87539.1 hypothetical protein DSCOOX_07190 [Desulfosarcina ovata subsp. ovata]